ncbi:MULTISPECIES: hypothetical protein [unclassified Rhodanobacter]|uniref:GNAT family N-acetyltransferase n=1 Tax=Rhodanobacter humi TaxID=1888173 RepID=A0ABV4ATE3_9GAMM
MSFTLQIQCATIEDAERILDVLRNNPAVLNDAGDDAAESAPLASCPDLEA